MGLIRNFSVGGARIEVDLDLQVGDKISYFWEANACIAAKVVWTHEAAFGVEHLEDPYLNRHSPPSRSVRVPCHTEARVWVGEQFYTALVENISLGGMRLKGLPEKEVGTLISVEFCGLELESATIRWSANEALGVRFARPLNRVMLAQLLLDQHFQLPEIEFGDHPLIEASHPGFKTPLEHGFAG